MKNTLPIKHRLANFLRHVRQTKRLRASAVCSEFRSIPWHRLSIRGGDIFLLSNDQLALNTPERKYIVRALSLLDALIKNQNLEILEIQATRIIAQINGVVFNLETWEDIYILNEVFHVGEYDIRLGSNYHVIDIGGNIGVAALYFASQPHVSKVDSFELVPATAERFKKNLELNPLLSKKITLHEYGLAADDRSLDIDYYPELAGSMGIAGIAERASQLNLDKKDCAKINVSVKNSVDIFRALIDQNPMVTFVAKIDCEGAEYEIIEALYRTGLLGQIHAFVIEWHELGPDILRERLESAGHFVTIKSNARDHHGVMCSVRHSI
jgi:FkbM family methyltransferase